MKYKGKINNLNHIVVSDPCYENGVWCRYEKNNLKEKDWLVNLDILPTETKIDDYCIRGNEFFLLIQKDEKDCSLDDNRTLSYAKNIELEDYTIGMDSACIALGINEKAKKIIDSHDEWQPLCAIKTGVDGTFGEVSEGIRDGKLCFLLINGYFEEDFIDQKDLLKYLTSQFEISDLVKEDLTSNKNIEKGEFEL